MKVTRNPRGAFIPLDSIRIWTGRGLLLGAASLLAGCATLPPPPPPAVPPPPRVITDGTTERIAPPPPVQRQAVIEETRKQEALSGDLVRFNFIRTVLLTDETLTLADGRTVRADEIRPILENELIARNFRIFSGSVPPETSVAQLTRDVHCHLVVKVKANGEFVNTTGKFSKFRARAEAQAIRGRDGTELALATVEANGPRKQDPERAGQLALREAATNLADQLVRDLMAKTDQLLWSALVVQKVDTVAKAKAIETQLAAQAGLGYVELLGWDEASRTATYEIMHGLKKDSDMIAALAQVLGGRVQIAAYQPDSMETLRRTMINFK